MGLGDSVSEERGCGEGWSVGEGVRPSSLKGFIQFGQPVKGSSSAARAAPHGAKNGSTPFGAMTGYRVA